MSAERPPLDGSRSPLYFGPAERPRFGWIHMPSASATRRDLGVVLCAPFGYESLCFHRSLRHLAGASAAAGLPTIRFDYDGTGDSAGGDLDADRLAQWMRSIDDAVDALRAQAGITRVVLVGVRLGALLAAYASRRHDVVAAALIAPVASGRAWLREMRAVQAAMGRPDPPPALALPEGVEETVGIRLDHAAREAISGLDTARLAHAPSRVLIIDRADRPPTTALRERLDALGATTEHASLPDYVEATLDPHEARVPTALIARLLAFLDAVAGPVPLTAVPALEAGTGLLVAPGVVEEPVYLDPEQRLFGIVARPADQPPLRALVLLNSGANLHTGNGRMYVTFARRLAARGWLVLRYDVSSVGESRAPAGARENDVYTARAGADLATALDFLRARHGLERPEVAGLCSGAYHGFRAAVAGLPIGGLFVINPLVFYWKEGMSLAYPAFKAVEAAERYGRAIRDPAKWKKLLRGDVALAGVARVVMSRVRDHLRAFVRTGARALHLPLAEDLGADLDRAVEQGARVRFVFSVGDPGERLLREGAGRRLHRKLARGEVRLAHLPGCDHSLSCAWMQEVLWQRMADELGIPQ